VVRDEFDLRIEGHQVRLYNSKKGVVDPCGLDEFDQRLEGIQVPLYNRTKGVVDPCGQRQISSETRGNSSSSIQSDEGS
jgi:hypothetical protein